MLPEVTIWISLEANQGICTNHILLTDDMLVAAVCGTGLSLMEVADVDV